MAALLHKIWNAFKKVQSIEGIIGTLGFIFSGCATAWQYMENLKILPAILLFLGCISAASFFLIMFIHISAKIKKLDEFFNIEDKLIVFDGLIRDEIRGLKDAFDEQNSVKNKLKIIKCIGEGGSKIICKVEFLNLSNQPIEYCIDLDRSHFQIHNTSNNTSHRQDISTPKALSLLHPSVTTFDINIPITNIKKIASEQIDNKQDVILTMNFKLYFKYGKLFKELDQGFPSLESNASTLKIRYDEDGKPLFELDIKYVLSNPL